MDYLFVYNQMFPFVFHFFNFYRCLPKEKIRRNGCAKYAYYNCDKVSYQIL